MRGVAGSAGAVAGIAFGIFTVAGAESLVREPAEYGSTGGINDAGPPSTNAMQGTLSRHLQASRQPTVTDDALDPIGTISIEGHTLYSSLQMIEDVDAYNRAASALTQRIEWAETEFTASQGTLHENNGDRSTAASFHKSLPHDDLGQVDMVAFDALIECIAEGDFDTCQEVPAGNDDGFLVNPLGGLAVDMAGAAGPALTIPSASPLNSEDLAAQLAEVYWMALTRDVPFSQYGVDDATVEAADNLATMPGFADMNMVAVGPDGRADPQTQLFRSTALGVETGPFVSQLLVNNFTIDSIEVEAKLTTFAPGVDYMADYDEWLFIQNGGLPVLDEEVDDVKRFIRNARDLATTAATDTINTEAYRAALILIEQGAISRFGFNGPYTESGRQVGFVNYGVSHLMRLVGTGELAQRSSWYQKWNVHLFARPEAVGGTLHNVLNGDLDNVFPDSLINNELLLRRVSQRNREITGQVFRRPRTYLVPQAVNEGSPTHPSYPSGHAVQNGAFATLLKALVGLERGASCFSDPVVPDDEGLNLLPYTGDECLTFEGEINKLAVNVAFGRQMMGIHWRMDGQEGLLLGEIAGVRILQQEAVAFPENEGYEFRLMSGQTIKLEPDGSFFIDNERCSGEAFMGADLCV